ncbi:MAG: Gfo/Idh/MocA family oxidoreductase [Ruminococcus sp.]|jgi:predicted dehydrogenase|nr:Gfo/Idh/MocA family oxidoreductase [Ruminococcus sp.]
MSEKTTKWGIMATGWIAERLADAINSVADAELTAVASRGLEKAEAFGKRYGAKRCYGTYEELAADPDIDIIYVASPTSIHYDNVKLCFEHGKNVLCEKSLTVTASETAELIKIAREKKLFFMEAMWMRCLPYYRKAVELVKAGKIGEIKTIRVDISKAQMYDPQNRFFNKALGGGTLLDLGVYSVTFLTGFLGYDYKDLYSRGYIGETGVDRDEVIVFDYGNAYTSSVVGFDIEDDNRAVIVGTEGRIVTEPDFWYGHSFKLFDKWGNFTEEFSEPHLCNGYEYEVMEAQACMNAGLLESKIIPLDTTLRIMEIMDEITAKINTK